MTEYLSLERAREVAGTRETLGELIGIPYAQWARQCHAISIQLLRTGRFGPGRIARGWAAGILGQHSWMVLGPDVYDPDAVVVDPTMWHWAGQPENGIIAERNTCSIRKPHGYGSIWAAGRPDEPTGKIIELTPSFELSGDARFFLSDDILGPLDRRGWGQLANGPMMDWPSGEIIAAMDDTELLKALVPIDILGMVTLRNPGGVYLAQSEDLLPV